MNEKKQTVEDLIFTLRLNMFNDIRHAVESIGIENSALVTKVIMGAILPYMVAFTYHDNDSTGEKE